MSYALDVQLGRVRTSNDPAWFQTLASKRTDDPFWRSMTHYYWPFHTYYINDINSVMNTQFYHSVSDKFTDGFIGKHSRQSLRAAVVWSARAGSSKIRQIIFVWAPSSEPTMPRVARHANARHANDPCYSSHRLGFSEQDWVHFLSVWDIVAM